MALEAVVYPQDFFGYSGKEMYNLLGGNWSCDGFGGVEEREEEKVVPFDHFPQNQTENYYYDANWVPTHPSMVPHLELSHMGSMVISEEFPQLDASASASGSPPTVPAPPTRIRRRSKSRKNQEEIENQRMTHIAVERNRRKQMNEYLGVLRSLMPDSYVPRGDQASIIGGAINYVKELEQRLQCLVGHKHMNHNFEATSSSPPPPFADFFTFPQYSTTGTCENPVTANDLTAENRSAIADIEVTMVETHANLKIRSKRRPKQLLKVVSGLQSLRLTILHLNVTTVGQIVLYCFSVKVEDDCKLISVGEIATAVNEMLGRIQEEALLI
ncbi:transcription factor bHLH94-like [Cornus florida]|uniref:transcription factor bHLH94-like n=1 Tax=Cornus florida TaxID=4283 RepID=UPI00289CD53F|nr:transcription factor bHLH94-like [Cornus florida]